MTATHTRGQCVRCKQVTWLVAHSIVRPIVRENRVIHTFTRIGQVVICQVCGNGTVSRVRRYRYPVVKGKGWLTPPGIVWWERIGYIADSKIWHTLIRQQVAAAFAFEQQYQSQHRETDPLYKLRLLMVIAALMRAEANRAADKPYYRMLEAA